MPTDLRQPAPLAATADTYELRHWLRVLREAYRRGAHVDVVILGESDGATTTCWSNSCPAADQKAAFLGWLSDSVTDADAFFVTEKEQ